jgi:hypothetical protein
VKPWNERPIEIRNLFNPSFSGLVLFRALSAYQEIEARGMPFSLSLLVLPLCLQRQSRETFQKGIRTYFMKVVAEHPELQIGLDTRCADLLPFTFEALGLLMNVEVLSVSSDGQLLVSSAGVQKTLYGRTEETIACQRVAAYLGREFARIADRGTVYSTLGIRP